MGGLAQVAVDHPVNDLISSIGRSSPAALAVVTELLRTWQAEITTGIRHMQRIGEVGPELDAERTSAALLAGIQGGVMVMRATGRVTHLEAALDVGIENLRASRPSSTPDGHREMSSAPSA